MRTQHPTSPFVDQAAYFSGRARFNLLDYVAAAVDFDASLVADPVGLFADNASYFAGRARYEAGLLPEAQASLQAFETAFPNSVLIDNGRYYLGRSFYNAGLLLESIPPFSRVSLTPGSIYEDNALYFTGRADYRLALFADAIAVFDTLEVTQPTSQYVDNALGWESRARLDDGDCPGARVTFVTLSTDFPASAEVARTDTCLIANGCP